MADKAQSFENHAKFVPLYHGAAFGLFVLNLAYWVARTVRGFSLQNLVMTGTAVALILLFFFARLFALKVQDRVIRLEERLRLQALLPDDLKARVGELTVDQLVAIRFASDGEVADLVRAVFDEGLTDRTDIKKRVRSWRADHLRA